MDTRGKIRTAVIPAAGIGTRFLPWTKAVPKEMLPIMDRPVIHYIVEECVGAGVEEIIIVTSWHKRAIEDYFDYSPELELTLKQQGKGDKLDELRELIDKATFVYLRQKGPYGNATPVLEAQKVVGDEPFVVLWGDQFIGASPSRLQQCLAVYEKYGKGVVSAIKVEDDLVPQSGMGRVNPLEGNVFELQEIVEKPSVEETPSRLMCSGVYIFQPEVFGVLKSLQPGTDGELWLVDAVNTLARENKMLACQIENGRFYDTGNRWTYHKTMVDFMIEDEEIGERIREYMRERLDSF